MDRDPAARPSPFDEAAPQESTSKPVGLVGRRRRARTRAAAGLAVSLAAVGLALGAAPASADTGVPAAGTPVRMVSSVTDRVLVASIDVKHLNDLTKTRVFFVSKEKADDIEDNTKGSTSYETWWVAQGTTSAIPTDSERVTFRSAKTFGGVHLCLDSTSGQEIYPHVCGSTHQVWKATAGACMGTNFVTFQNEQTYKWIRDYRGKAKLKNCNNRGITFFARA